MEVDINIIDELHAELEERNFKYVELSKVAARKDNEIGRLKEEIQVLKCRIKRQDEQISELSEEYTKEDKTTDEVGDNDDEPAIDDEGRVTKKYISEKIKDAVNLKLDKLTEIGKQIHKTVDERLKEFETNMNSSKLNLTSKTHIQSSKTVAYADMVKGSLSSKLREQNQILVHDNDKNIRKVNVIIHGRVETEDDENTDDIFIKKLLHDLQVQTLPKSMLRIGSFSNLKKRPIKLTFDLLSEKQQVMRNLRNLKGKNEYIGISIRDDYTIEERMLLKEKTQKAREANMTLPNNCDYTWQVRGTPDTGIIIKRISRDTRRENAPYHERKNTSTFEVTPKSGPDEGGTNTKVSDLTTRARVSGILPGEGR